MTEQPKKKPVRLGPVLDVDAPDAIMSSDTGARLDGILRRLGGKSAPRPIEGRVILPPVGKRSCKDQAEITFEGNE